MSVVPRSLFGRLLALATFTTALALVVAGFGIGHILERFVMRSLDDRLDAQVMVLARAVGPDGALRTAHVVDLPGFDRADSGWRWQVTSPAGAWQNVAGPITMTARPRPSIRPRIHPRGPAPGEARDAQGRRLHLRTLTIATPRGAVTILAAGPRRVVEAPLHEAMAPLLASLLLLAIGLTIATLVQLRLGLRPLAALRRSVARVGAGEATMVPADQPRELAPLAAELNTLIAQNAAQLAQARMHVANLAHGLKTPLAALALTIERRGVDTDGALLATIADIDSRIVHHLRRARAGAAGGGRQRAEVGDAVAALVAVLRLTHRDKPLTVDHAIAAPRPVAVDGQDLDEMLGNLLDNGWRHATATLRISAEVQGAMLTIAIDDDGPGLTAAERDDAMIAGRRLDERTPGHGFGLPITEELANLYGGTLRLRASPVLAGLRAELSLPLTPPGDERPI